MNISLRPETARLLQQKLDSGAFQSADDVVLAALEALERQSNLDETALDAIDRAEDQIDRGEVRNWKDVRDQVRAGFFGK